MVKFPLVSALFLLSAGVFCRGELVWENPEQEFQRTPEDQGLAVDFTFRNKGDSAVTITRITPSCGCTTAELSKKTYAPGETGKLAAKFTFGGRRGPQAKSITVGTDDGKTAQLTFKCLILDDPVALSQSLVFWRVGEAAEAKSVKVSVAATGNVKIASVASTSPRIQAALSPRQEDGKYTVTIHPLDTAQKESAEVFVQSDFPIEGPKAYTIQVRVK